MILYWIGDAVLLLVILPVVILLLRPVHAAATGIVPHIAAIAGAAERGSKDLDAVPLLLTTQDQVQRTVAAVADYGGSLDTIVDDA